MVTMDVLMLKTDIKVGEERLNDRLEIVDLGKVELKSGQFEIVRMVRFAGKNDVGTWMGLFIPEDKEDGWNKWLLGSGFKDKAINVELTAEKQERLKMLSGTNIPPIHIFNLAMNSDMDLPEVVTYYSHLKGPAMLAIGSERSEQGKSTLTAIEASMWGGSNVLTADIFAGDNGAALKKILAESGWDGRDVKEAFEIISAGRVWEKLEGMNLGEYLNWMWERWSNSFGFTIVDLPGMRIENDQDTRLRDGMDALRLAMPCYEIPSMDKKSEGFDEEYQREITKGYYQAIKDTWHLDEERVAGLRKLLQ